MDKERFDFHQSIFLDNYTRANNYFFNALKLFNSRQFKSAYNEMEWCEGCLENAKNNLQTLGGANYNNDYYCSQVTSELSKKWEILYFKVKDLKNKILNSINA